jgi:hypothetical protein
MEQTDQPHNDRIIKIIELAKCDFQIVIYQNGLGTYSFAKRWLEPVTKVPGMLGPSCGSYDSAKTAEQEARARNFFQPE